jgi:hypothetical protein
MPVVLPWCVINRSHACASAPARQLHRSSAFAPCVHRQNATLCFQPLAHSLQFANRDIPTIFLSLRTLCQKHPGVGVDPLPNFSGAKRPRHTTPTESHCSTFAPSNPFRIYLFPKTPHANPLQSISFTKHRGSGPPIFPYPPHFLTSLPRASLVFLRFTHVSAIVAHAGGTGKKCP